MAEQAMSKKQLQRLTNLRLMVIQMVVKEATTTAALLAMAEAYSKTKNGGEPAAKQAKRMELLKRDKYKCYLCHRKFAPDELVLDHVLPRSRGGTGDAENRRAACMPCDRRKGNRTLDELDWYKPPRVRVAAKKPAAKKSSRK